MEGVLPLRRQLHQSKAGINSCVDSNTLVARKKKTSGSKTPIVSKHETILVHFDWICND